MTADLDNHPNKAWKIARTLRGRSSRIPAFEENDLTIIDDNTKANLLATRFAEAHRTFIREPGTFERHDEKITKIAQEIYNLPTMEADVVLISINEIQACLKSLKPNKAPGPDGITNKLLKSLPFPATVKLTAILNACLLRSYWPNKWKIGKVVAIGKPGKKRSLATSYRPISVINTTSKLFEKIIKDRLAAYAEQNDLLNAEQFGFRAGRSAQQQVLRVIKQIRRQKAARKSTGMVTMDIMKAFDTVWHDGLIAKMSNANVPIHLTKTIQQWLTNRRSYVSVGSATSALHNIPAGTPQGSSLSPLLYSLYVSDIPIPNNCSLAIYADDTAIITQALQGRCIANRLNKGFEVINKFLERWRIKANPTKTEALFAPFDGRKCRLPKTPLALTDDTEIQYADVVRYLGINIDRKLNFRQHVLIAHTKTTAASKAIYALIARSSMLPTKRKRHIYLAILRPIMLYGAEVWKDAAKTNIQKLQVLQSGILKTIYKLPRRYPTDQLHQMANIPLVNDHIQLMHTNMQQRCAMSDAQIVRALAE